LSSSITKKIKKIKIFSKQNCSSNFSEIVGAFTTTFKKGPGFESHPIQDKNGFKAMPGLIYICTHS